MRDVVARSPSQAGVPHNRPSDPTALQDVFFPIGGPHVGKATVALEVSSDNTILDDLWIQLTGARMPA